MTPVWQTRSNLPPQQRWRVALGVALVHGALWWLWASDSGVPQRDDEPGGQRTTVVLLPPAEVDVVPSSPVPRQPALTGPRRERVELTSVPRAAEAVYPPAATPADRPSAELVAPPAAATATRPSERAAGPSGELNLRLPQDAASQRSRQAVNPAFDQQVGLRVAPAGLAVVDAAIASALPSGAWQMERIDVGTVRYRQGSQCVTARSSRAEQLDPINSRGSGADKPWVVSAPESC